MNIFEVFEFLLFGLFVIVMLVVRDEYFGLPETSGRLSAV